MNSTDLPSSAEVVAGLAKKRKTCPVDAEKEAYPLTKIKRTFEDEVETSARSCDEENDDEDADRKLAAKREYNRKNSARARQRVKERMTELTQKVFMLEDKLKVAEEANAALEKKVAALTEENETVRGLLATVTQNVPQPLARNQFGFTPTALGDGHMHSGLSPLTGLQRQVTVPQASILFKNYSRGSEDSKFSTKALQHQGQSLNLN